MLLGIYFAFYTMFQCQTFIQIYALIGLDKNLLKWMNVNIVTPTAVRKHGQRYGGGGQKNECSLICAKQQKGASNAMQEVRAAVHFSKRDSGAEVLGVR